MNCIPLLDENPLLSAMMLADQDVCCTPAHILECLCVNELESCDAQWLLSYGIAICAEFSFRLGYPHAFYKALCSISLTLQSSIPTFPSTRAVGDLRLDYKIQVSNRCTPMRYTKRLAPEFLKKL